MEILTGEEGFRKIRMSLLKPGRETSAGISSTAWELGVVPNQIWSMHPGGEFLSFLDQQRFTVSPNKVIIHPSIHVGRFCWMLFNKRRHYVYLGRSHVFHSSACEHLRLKKYTTYSVSPVLGCLDNDSSLIYPAFVMQPHRETEARTTTRETEGTLLLLWPERDVYVSPPRS